MATLQIRDLPDDIHQCIGVAAVAEHRSLSRQAIDELRRAPGLVAGLGDTDRRVALIDRLRTSERRLPATPDSAGSPEDLIRMDRDDATTKRWSW